MSLKRKLVTILVIMALPGIGCEYLEDRFKTCRDTRVDLVNSDQSLAAMHIVGPNERATDATLLEPRQTRRTMQCLERGDTRKYRAIPPGQWDPVAIVNCVAANASYEGDVLEVVWTVRGFRCEGW